MQLHDALKDPEKLSKFIVEALYGATNKASVMLPHVNHVPRPQACTLYKKQMLCAAACARLVTSRQPYSNDCMVFMSITALLTV